MESFSANYKNHFLKKRSNRSDFVKLSSRKLYLALAEKLALVCCCNNLSDFALFFINCSSRRAEKDAVMYLNSTIDRSRTVGISRFQFYLILQICKDAIELTSRQEVCLLRQTFFRNEIKECFINIIWWFWFQDFLDHIWRIYPSIEFGIYDNSKN